MTPRAKRKPRARPWTWEPGPADPAPAALKAAVVAALKAAKAAQAPGPRTVKDLAAAMSVGLPWLRSRLDGRRPLTWADAERVAAAVGLALGDVYPAHQGAAAPDSQEGG